MKSLLLTLTAFVVLFPAWQEAKAEDVSFDFFYNNLSGGSWIEVGDYGYCWQPDVAVGNPNWRPYADGYWAYTELGWTWVSYEDFGWATYHYGRWARLADLGWVWVPGQDQDLEWGPAWVSWRTGPEYVGWAALPPSGEAVYDGGAITGDVDAEFNIGPGCYNFVDIRYIGEPVLRERIFERSLNATHILQTVNVTNITYKNKVVYNYGPDITVINAHSQRPIQRLRFERQENDAGASAAGGLTKVQGDRLIVGVPAHISKPGRQVAPPTVKTRVAKANLDTGWSIVGDAAAQEQFKQKIKTQNLNKTLPTTNVNPAGQVGTLPAVPATPTQVGKGEHINRLGQQIPPNAAGGALPARAFSPAAPSSPSPPNTMGQGGTGRNQGMQGVYAQPAGAGQQRQPQGRPDGSRKNKDEGSPAPSPQ